MVPLLLLLLLAVCQARVPESAASAYRRAARSVCAGLVSLTAATAASTAASAAARGALARAPAECSDAVSVLRSGRRRVVLVGTAHISEQSAQLVRRTVAAEQPQVVVVELDAKRVGSVKSLSELKDAGFTLPSSSVFVDPVQTSQKPLGPLAGLVASLQSFKEAAAGLVLGKVLSSFYRSVESMGFESGGEFRAAIEEGRKCGATILLGDRDVDVTLQRLAAAFQNTSAESVERLVDRVETLNRASSGMDDSALLQRDTLALYVERIKQRGALDSLLQAVREEAPAVYAALIGERDLFLADSIDGARADALVAVVGIAHMSGIERALGERGFTLLRSNCPA